MENGGVDGIGHLRVLSNGWMDGYLLWVLISFKKFCQNKSFVKLVLQSNGKVIAKTTKFVVKCYDKVRELQSKVQYSRAKDATLA